MTKNPINPTMTAILADEVRIAEQSAAKAQRIAELRTRLAGVRAKVAEQAAAHAAPTEQARAALQAAILAGDDAAVEEARSEAEAAARRPAPGNALEIEALALQEAIAQVEAEQSELSRSREALAPRMKAALLARLEAEGADLSGELERNARALMGTYAKARALSELFEAAGGGAGRFGPNIMEPLRLLNVGADRATTGRLYVTAVLVDALPAARNAAQTKLRAEGFRL